MDPQQEVATNDASNISCVYVQLYNSIQRKNLITKSATY
jgi:hypothetical protein